MIGAEDFERTIAGQHPSLAALLHMQHFASQHGTPEEAGVSARRVIALLLKDSDDSQTWDGVGAEAARLWSEAIGGRTVGEAAQWLIGRLFPGVSHGA